MPYINRRRADELRDDPHDSISPAELAFVFCDIADTYIGPHVRAGSIIEVLGALEETKLELARRVSNPHEAEANHPGAAEPFFFSGRR